MGPVEKAGNEDRSDCQMTGLSCLFMVSQRWNLCDILLCHEKWACDCGVSSSIFGLYTQFPRAPVPSPAVMSKDPHVQGLGHTAPN